jgi:hypothetical protein
VGLTHATWHSLIGPRQQPLHQTEAHDTILLVQTYICQQGRGDMATPQAATSSDACHVAAYHEATSPFEIQQLDRWQQAIGPRQHMWAPLCAMWHSQDSAQSVGINNYNEVININIIKSDKAAYRNLSHQHN